MSYSQTINFTLTIENNEVLVYNNHNNLTYTISLHTECLINDKAYKVQQVYDNLIDTALIIINSQSSTNHFLIDNIYEVHSPELILITDKNKTRLKLKKTSSKSDLMNKLSTINNKEILQNNLKEIFSKVVQFEFYLKDRKENLVNQQIKLLNEVKMINDVTLDNLATKRDQFKIILDNLISKHGKEQFEDMSNAKFKKTKSHANEKPTIKLTDVDIRYADIQGQAYCCIGINSGCTKRVVYGSNPYTTDSALCTAALHCGLINENGGIFVVKKIGSLNIYPSSTSNDVTTTQWNSAWEGVSLHQSDIEVLAHTKFEYCGQYNK
jgi:hypothetical protein